MLNPSSGNWLPFGRRQSAIAKYYNPPPNDVSFISLLSLFDNYLGVKSANASNLEIGPLAKIGTKTTRYH